MDNQKKNNKSESAIVFVNGTYQFIVGYACAKRHFADKKLITIIGYDMKRNPKMSKMIDNFCNELNLNFLNLPFELNKSSADYTKTYRLASLWNFFVCYLVSKFSKASNIFLPKLYNNPERAIIAGAANKKVFIYDDGIGLYTERIIAKKTNKYISTLHLINSPEIIYICPSNPELYTSSIEPGFELIKSDYRIEMKDIIENLSSCLTIKYSDIPDNSILILLCFSRLSTIQKDLPKLHEIMLSILNKFENIKFVIKPHPRDFEIDIINQFKILTQLNNCKLLQKENWIYPVELLIMKYQAKIVLSAVSTIALNQYFFEETNIFVSSLLGEKEADLEINVIELMKKTNNYFGDNVQSIVDCLESTIDQITWTPL